MRSSLFVLCAVLFACVVSCRAAEEEDPRIQEIRRRMDTLMERHAQAIIKEQSTPREQADAALAIGAFHELGMLGEVDPIKAEAYYRIAVKLGSPEAECALGNFLSVGVEGATGSIKRDFSQALEYYRRAAEGGSVKAMVRLGEIYADGIGVEADSKKALGYFVEAARRGDADAINKLEPVMRQAREWEAARPGRKANFPTSREMLIDSGLARADRQRNDQLTRNASHIYVELNRRIGDSAKEDTK